MAQLVTNTTEQLDFIDGLTQHWQQPIQRLFWMYDVPTQATRGGHRHQADCQMILHCPVGRLTVYVQTPDQDHTYVLESSDQYLLLDGSDWRLMYDFSPDAVLSVIASHSFEQTAYYERPYRPYRPVSCLVN